MGCIQWKWWSYCSKARIEVWKIIRVVFERSIDKIDFSIKRLDTVAGFIRTRTCFERGIRVIEELTASDAHLLISFRDPGIDICRMYQVSAAFSLIVQKWSTPKYKHPTASPENPNWTTNINQHVNQNACKSYTREARESKLRSSWSMASKVKQGKTRENNGKYGKA